MSGATPTSWTVRLPGLPPGRELSSQLEAKARALQEATTHRSSCEDAQRGEENRLAHSSVPLLTGAKGWPG